MWRAIEFIYSNLKKILYAKSYSPYILKVKPFTFAFHMAPSPQHLQSKSGLSQDPVLQEDKWLILQ